MDTVEVKVYIHYYVYGIDIIIGLYMGAPIHDISYSFCSQLETPLISQAMI